MAFVAVAVLLVAGFWLVPVEFTVLGTSVSCGTPIHPDTVTLTPAATATVTAFAATVADAEDDWAIELSAYGIEPGDADIYRRAVHVAIDRAAHQLRATQPDWLTDRQHETVEPVAVRSPSSSSIGAPSSSN